ncbi:MAG: TIR domain-containing protein [Nitrospirota bacterium]
MSKSLRASIRDRWSSRSMVVTRWLTGAEIRTGDAICEAEADGIPLTITATEIEVSDYGVPMWHYVVEGGEIGPWGTLVEVSTSAAASDKPRRFHPASRRAYRRRERYPRVFLNYRRDDADAHSGRLHEALTSRFGRDAVFMDLFSIQPGEVFSWTIQQAVVHASVVVALIGPKWLSLTDAYGQKRLASDFDFVRRELTAAWDRGIPIIPVLLPGASVPAGPSVPEPLSGLQELQMIELHPRYWDAAFAELCDAIERELSIPAV